ncbi:MAG: DUF4231 domain-containing protein [Chloroflexota bacterium]
MTQFSRSPAERTWGALWQRTPFPGWRKWYKKRTPFGRDEPKEWSRPASEEAYQEALYWEGFITPDYWDDDDLRTYPAINQDLDDLEDYLLPSFWEYNQRARFYQRSYYYYQWVFIIGAFMTTVFGAMTTYFTVDGESGVMLFGQSYYWVTLPIIGQQNFTMAAMLSLATTIVSAITSYFTLLSNQGEPRKRWANYRRLAEELRMLYFKFVSRLPPYDKANRVEKLRYRVIEIREQEPSSA